MFVAMGEQLYPHHPGRPNHSGYDIYTPNSAVSSFNLPCNYDSNLTTPVSQNADSPILAMKVAVSPWGREQHQMNYPMRESGPIFHQNTNARMKSNAKDSHLSLQVPHDSSDIPVNFSPYMFDSPQNACPPTPYWGSYGVSGPQVTSPAASIPSNAHSTPQLTNASTPSIHSTPIHNTPIHNNAPILTQPTPGQLRPGKRAQESPIKTEHQAMQFQHHPAQQPSLSPHHFNQPMKRESPPLSMAMNKRRKPSDPMTPIYAQNQRPSPVDNTAAALNATLQGNQSRQTPIQTSQYKTNEEERLLLHLRDERDPKPDWKKTAAEFNERMGKNFRVPALQMRYQRLRERLRPWTEKDIKALKSSKAAFEKMKWETIAQGMMQHGCSEKWSARACQLKHAELNPEELDEAPEERSPGFETEFGSARSAGYLQESAMGVPGQQMMGQQQQIQEFEGRDGRSGSREHSADGRTDGRAADAGQQLLMRQQRLVQQK